MFFTTGTKGLAWRASAPWTLDTGWKPMLQHAVARRGGSAEKQFWHDREPWLDAQEGNDVKASRLLITLTSAVFLRACL